MENQILSCDGTIKHFPKHKQGEKMAAEGIAGVDSMG